METHWIYSIIFYGAAALSIAAALMVIFHRNPVINALYLVLCFVGVAVLYILLQAHFLAVLQVLLYAGAVLVLFLMIIMLMNLEPDRFTRAKPKLVKVLGVFAAAGVVLVILSAVQAYMGFPAKSGRQPGTIGVQDTPERIAALLTALGSDKKALSAEPPKASISEDEKILIARSVLARFKPPGTLYGLGWSAPFNRYADRQLEALRTGILQQLVLPVTLSALQVPAGFEDLKTEDLLVFIKTAAEERGRQLKDFGSTAAVGRVVFTRYLLPFEAASILLLGAIVGVLVLARRSPNTRGS